MPNKLSPKQQLFIKEYQVDLNATQAAIRAGYSARTANEQGARLLAKVSVRAELEEAMKGRATRLDITADRVLQEVAAIAYAKLGDYVDIEPSGIRIKSGSDVDTRVLSEVTERTTKEGTTVSIKLHDKVAALDKMMRYLGLMKDKVELTGKDGGPIQMEQRILTPAEVDKQLQEMGLLPAGGKPNGG